jgi:hypothetical protein
MKTNQLIILIKNDKKMIKEYFNQYEYDTDYEFDVDTVDDIKNERMKDEVLALY